MWDFVLQLLAHPNSMDALMWVLSAIGTFLAAKVVGKMPSPYLRDAMMRLGLEVESAVKAVHQTYVDAIKKAREDGVLTPEEAAKAKQMAVDVLKANFGLKGLKSLMKVLGLDEAGLDKYLGTKVEASVAELKSPPQ